MRVVTSAVQLDLALDPAILRVRIAQRELWLCAGRAAFCPVARALFVADVHLGKAMSFRSLGVPVPAGTTALTLERLSALIEVHRPRAVYVLGDLLHGPAVQNTTAIEALALWRARHHALDVVLIRGNHDDRSGDPPAHCGVRVVADGLSLSGWVLCHAPRDDARGHVLAGHLHPAFRVRGRVDSVRLPAFWVRPGHTVLPAFGEFTGGAPISVVDGDRVYLTDGTRMHTVPDPCAFN